MHYPTLPAKTLCSIPSTHLQGFRNYIATILKSYLRGMSIILLGLLCAVQCHVTCCIVMFCCFPLLTVGDILLPEFLIVSIILFLHWSSSFMGVNCWIHSIFYGANYSSHHVSSFLTGANCLSHPIYFMVLTVQATMLLAFSQVLTIWATLLYMVLLFKPPLFLVLSWALTVWPTLFYIMVVTVKATMFLAFSRVLTVWATQYFLWC